MDLANVVGNLYFRSSNSRSFVPRFAEMSYFMDALLHTMFPFGPWGPSIPAMPFKEEKHTEAYMFRCYNRTSNSITLS